MKNKKVFSQASQMEKIKKEVNRIKKGKTKTELAYLIYILTMTKRRKLQPGLEIKETEQEHEIKKECLNILSARNLNTSSLVNGIRENTGIGRNRVREIIELLIHEKFLERFPTGEKNSYIYELRK